jgi:hypothetical protein
VFIRSLCLFSMIALAAPAVATFELKDPAADIYAEEKAAASLGERSCFDLLVDSVERPEIYREAVDWVGDAVGSDQAAVAMEAALRKFCIDHPKRSIAEAVMALGAAPDSPTGN